VAKLLPVTNSRPSPMAVRLTRPIIIHLMSHVRRPPIVHGCLHCFQYDCPAAALLLKVSIVIIISSYYARRFMGSCNFVRAALILGLPRTRGSPFFFHPLGLFDVRCNFAEFSSIAKIKITRNPSLKRRENISLWALFVRSRHSLASDLKISENFMRNSLQNLYR